MAKGLGSWARAPLVLAVAEIVFAQRARFPVEAEELGKLQQRNIYPRFEQGELQILQVSQSPGEMHLENRRVACRVYMDATAKVAFRITPERLSFFDADYTNDFRGLLERFSVVLEAWFNAAPSLALSEVRLRMLDVVLPIDGCDLATALKPEWRAGSSTAQRSIGLAMRDYDLPDGSNHIRVRDALLRSGQKLAPPQDLMAAVPVALSEAFMGPFDQDIRQLWVDTERAINLRDADGMREVLAALEKAHEELSANFKSIFEHQAIAFFRGDSDHA